MMDDNNNNQQGDDGEDKNSDNTRLAKDDDKKSSSNGVADNSKEIEEDSISKQDNGMTDETTKNGGNDNDMIVLGMDDIPLMESKEDDSPQHSHQQQQQQQQKYDDDGGCFFADATLDLEEAHNIAADVSVVTTEPPATSTDNNNVSTHSSFNRVGASLSSPSHHVDNIELIGMEQQQQPQKFSQVRPLMSISNKTMMASPTASSSSNPLPTNRSTYRPRSPRRPRDVPWALAALLLIPTSFLYPLHIHNTSVVVEEEGKHHWTSASSVVMTSGSSLFFSFMGTIVLARLLYRSPGGGDGEDARHLAARIIVSIYPISLIIFPLWVLFVVIETPQAKNTWVWLPSLCFVHGVWVYRERIFSAPLHNNNNNNTRQRNNNNNSNNDYSYGSESMFATVDPNDGRRTFFRELTCMALDILSRSLRRQSFYRVVNALLALQFILLLIWRHVFYISLELTSTSTSRNLLTPILPLIVLLGGKWATGIMTRILGLVASGGVTAWFAQQSILMDEMERMRSNTPTNNVDINGDNHQTSHNNSGSDDEDGYDSVSDDEDNYVKSGRTRKDSAGNAAARAALHSMPKAYRSADANAYKPIIDFDDGIDDDYDEDENFGNNKPSLIMKMDGKGMGVSSSNNNMHNREWTGGGSGGGSTVKSFLICAATVSFGSVAQCGMLGGLAQFIWGAVRNMDSLLSILSRRSNTGFRGMRIAGGEAAAVTADATEQVKEQIVYLWKKFDVMARDFVRNNSDLAMSHVAAYFKSYQRAANDVLSLIDASGVEPIIHDDITSHMCFAVCTAVAGLITLFESFILSKHRASSDMLLSDKDICKAMWVSFLFSYVMVFTIMEPLRASIKAVYVCFAQHPLSLSQAYPLIFHRLSRISDSNLV